MPNRFVVRPSSAGWYVEGPGLAARLEFASGAQAEAAGRQLARQRAATGVSSEVLILLRDESVAGVFHFCGRAPQTLGAHA
jgi:hypothetical protein